MCVSLYNFHCFLPQQSDGLCDATRLFHSNWLPKQFAHTHIHDRWMSVCVCVLIASTDLCIVQWLTNRSLSDGETLDRFFRSFLRVCVCVITFCEERAVVCAFRFPMCVCVSICREESFALQLMGSIHSNLVSFEIKKINKK